MPDLVDRVDAWQRRHPVAGFPLAVVYKFFDDQGGYLAAAVTYYAFIAIFPLMLIGSSVLGFVLQGHPDLEQQILNSALRQFPIVGEQLGRPEGLRGSTSAVVIGAVTALYGVIGLGQVAHNAINVCWAIPRNSRLNPIVSRLRSLVWIAGAGLALVLMALVTSLGSHLDVLDKGLGPEVHWLAVGLSILVTAGVLAVMMRVSTPLEERWREGYHYLGEWHFHPRGSPTPSGNDRRAMAKIALDDVYRCPEPILVILGGRPKSDWSLSATLFRDGRAVELFRRMLD